MEPLELAGRTVLAYSLARIAGEKLRAFLTSLPTYRSKLNRPGEAVRAKDLFDLTMIFRNRPLPGEAAFWESAGREFHIACESRYVDCIGLGSFREQWDVTRKTYESSGAVGRDIPFEEVEATLRHIVTFLEEHGVVPFEFPLPPCG